MPLVAYDDGDAVADGFAADAPLEFDVVAAAAAAAAAAVESDVVAAAYNADVDVDVADKVYVVRTGDIAPAPEWLYDPPHETTATRFYRQIS